MHSSIIVCTCKACIAGHLLAEAVAEAVAVASPEELPPYAVAVAVAVAAAQDSFRASGRSFTVAMQQLDL